MEGLAPESVKSYFLRNCKYLNVIFLTYSINTVIQFTILYCSKNGLQNINIKEGLLFSAQKTKIKINVTQFC
jgi:hypothetical protein